MTTPEVGRLARRADELDASLRALSDTLLDIQETVDGHTEQFAAVREELGAVRSTLAGHDRELEAVRSALAGHDGEFEAVRSTLAGHDREFEAMRSTLAGHTGLLTEILRRLEAG